MSSILLVIYIDDLPQLCPNTTEQGVMLREMGKADITLIEDDVVVHKSN